MTPKLPPERPLLLGEWACLGALYTGPMHGFAIAARLKPDGDLGRVWSLSRALTYRSLEQLITRGYVEAVGEEQGIAGGNRTILAGTRLGRARLRTWLTTPVAHLRDVRSELLLKLVIAELCGVDTTEMVREQRAHVIELGAVINNRAATDLVSLWRSETAEATMRFLDHLLTTPDRQATPDRRLREISDGTVLPKFDTNG